MATVMTAHGVRMRMAKSQCVGVSSLDAPLCQRMIPSNNLTTITLYFVLQCDNALTATARLSLVRYNLWAEGDVGPAVLCSIPLVAMRWKTIGSARTSWIGTSTRLHGVAVQALLPPVEQRAVCAHPSKSKPNPSEGACDTARCPCWQCSRLGRKQRNLKACDHEVQQLFCKAHDTDGRCTILQSWVSIVNLISWFLF